jgi:hypothetical protein
MGPSSGTWRRASQTTAGRAEATLDSQELSRAPDVRKDTGPVSAAGLFRVVARCGPWPGLDEGDENGFQVSLSSTGISVSKAAAPPFVGPLFATLVATKQYDKALSGKPESQQAIQSSNCNPIQSNVGSIDSSVWCFQQD